MDHAILIDAYYHYCLNGWLSDKTKKVVSAFSEHQAFKEKILPMLVYTSGKNNTEYDRIEREKEEKSIVLKEISHSTLLQNSVLVLKGLSIERLYHANSTRFAFDADLVVLEGHLPELNDLLSQHCYDIHSSTPWIKDIVTNKVYKSFRYTKGYNDDRGFEVHVDYYPIDNDGSKILLHSLYSGCYNTILKGTAINVVSDLNALIIMFIQIHYKENLTIRDFVDLIILLENSDFHVHKYALKALLTDYKLGNVIIKLQRYIETHTVALDKYHGGAPLSQLIELNIPPPAVNTHSGPLPMQKMPVAANADSKALFDSGYPVSFYRLSKTEVIDDNNCFKVETDIGVFYGQAHGEFLIYE